MRKSLWVFIFAAAAGLCSILYVILSVDSQKGKIVVTETVLEGDVSAAEGVSVEIGTHWKGKLLWNTVYRPGHVQDAASSFDFSGQRTEWDSAARGWFSGYSYSDVSGRWGEREAVALDMTTAFGTALGKNAGGDRDIFEVRLEDGDLPWAKLLRAAAEQTAAGETRTVTLRAGDYYEYYPLKLMLAGEGGLGYSNYKPWDEFITDFLKLPIPDGERFLVTIQKDGNDRVIDLQCSSTGEGYFPVTCSARGDAGCFFSFYLTGRNQGFEEVQREFGRQYAIYWIPHVDTRRISNLDPEGTRSAALLPEGAIPVAMRLDGEGEFLYLLALQGGQHLVLTYLVDTEKLTLLGQIPFPDAFNDLDLTAGDEERIQAFRKMIVQEDGILLTWRDNRFVFIAGTGEECRFWCSGIFPMGERAAEVLGEQNPPGRYSGFESTFPYAPVFAFDGTKLALAAFEDWDSLDTRLLVYREGQLAYSGLYRHSGEMDEALGIVYRISPWGYNNLNGMRQDAALPDPLRVNMEPQDSPK